MLCCTAQQLQLAVETCVKLKYRLNLWTIGEQSSDFQKSDFKPSSTVFSVHDDFDDDEHDHEEEENLILPEVWIKEYSAYILQLLIRESKFSSQIWCRIYQLVVFKVPTDNADDDVKEETTGRRATRAMFSRYADQVCNSLSVNPSACQFVCFFWCQPITLSVVSLVNWKPDNSRSFWTTTSLTASWFTSHFES